MSIEAGDTAEWAWTRTCTSDVLVLAIVPGGTDPPRTLVEGDLRMYECCRWKHDSAIVTESYIHGEKRVVLERAPLAQLREKK